jgi:GntR family transcriptional regulator
MSKADRFETRPLYMQVRDMLLGRITTGVWKPGTLIPNEIDLAREFGLSVGTVRKALDQLQAEHLLTRRQGRGTFVNDLASSEHTTRFNNLYYADGSRMTLDCETVSVSEETADDEACQALELKAGDAVVKLVRRRTHGGAAWIHEVSTVPSAIFPGLRDDQEIPCEIAALAQKYGQIAGTAEEKISVAAATKALSSELAVAKGTALLALHRRVRAVDGTPLEWRVAMCNLTEGYYKCVVS